MNTQTDTHKCVCRERERQRGGGSAGAWTNGDVNWEMIEREEMKHD